MPEYYKGKHKFEHWYLDRQVYFITAKTRSGFPAFSSEEAKSIFWDRFDKYTGQHDFIPFVTSLLSNHYHTIGFLRVGRELGPMMRKLHGSVAKLVNDLLPERRKEFWRGDGVGQGYFDGCIRNEKQCRNAYRYTLTQGARHGLVRNGCDYLHTRVNVDIDRAVKRAFELDAFLTGGSLSETRTSKSLK
ncbi:MAG: hypothetical protein AAGI46_02750 [Planctomycetota bacterium]